MAFEKGQSKQRSVSPLEAPASQADLSPLNDPPSTTTTNRGSKILLSFPMTTQVVISMLPPDINSTRKIGNCPRLAKLTQPARMSRDAQNSSANLHLKEGSLLVYEVASVADIRAKLTGRRSRSDRFYFRLWIVGRLLLLSLATPAKGQQDGTRSGRWFGFGRRWSGL